MKPTKRILLFLLFASITINNVFAEWQKVNELFLGEGRGNAYTNRSIEINSKTDKIYISHTITPNITEYDSETMSILERINLNILPKDIKIDSKENKLYISDSGHPQYAAICIIDGYTNNIINSNTYPKEIDNWDYGNDSFIVDFELKRIFIGMRLRDRDSDKIAYYLTVVDATTLE
ncbi:YncE family protein, partial [Candidatus Latescibacterota bacterium]